MKTHCKSLQQRTSRKAPSIKNGEDPQCLKSSARAHSSIHSTCAPVSHLDLNMFGLNCPTSHFACSINSWTVLHILVLRSKVFHICTGAQAINPLLEKSLFGSYIHHMQGEFRGWNNLDAAASNSCKGNSVGDVQQPAMASDNSAQTTSKHNRTVLLTFLLLPSRLLMAL